MSNTLFACFPCPIDSQESVSTEIKLCEDPHTTGKIHLSFYPLQPALKSNEVKYFHSSTHLSETKQNQTGASGF